MLHTRNTPTEDMRTHDTHVFSCNITMPKLKDYRFTGEYRRPYKGEYYWQETFHTVMECKETMEPRCRRFIVVKKQQEVTVSLTVPEGFEFTGEWRNAIGGEYYLHEETLNVVHVRGVSGPTICSHFILRKVV